MATWQCSNATQHSRLDQSADDERLLQPWAEQVVKFMRHFGFEFDRCMDVISTKACLFGADDVLEHIIGTEQARLRTDDIHASVKLETEMSHEFHDLFRPGLQKALIIGTLIKA